MGRNLFSLTRGHGHSLGHGLVTVVVDNYRMLSRYEVQRAAAVLRGLSIYPDVCLLRKHTDIHGALLTRGLIFSLFNILGLVLIRGFRGVLIFIFGRISALRSVLSGFLRGEWNGACDDQDGDRKETPPKFDVHISSFLLYKVAQDRNRGGPILLLHRRCWSDGCLDERQPAEADP